MVVDLWLLFEYLATVPLNNWRQMKCLCRKFGQLSCITSYLQCHMQLYNFLWFWRSWSQVSDARCYEEYVVHWFHLSVSFHIVCWFLSRISPYCPSTWRGRPLMAAWTNWAMTLVESRSLPNDTWRNALSELIGQEGIALAENIR